MLDAERTQRDLWLARQGAAKSTEGVVVSVDFLSRSVVVDTGGINRVATWAGPAPLVGSRVRFVQAGQQAFVVSAAEGSTFGTIVSVASGVATVTGDDGTTYRYPYEFGASFSSGHRVALDHARQLVLFRLSTDVATSTPEGGASAPSSARVTKSFKPVGSSNWYSDASRWDSDFAEISLTRSAYYFYGRQIDDSIPDGATIISGYITLSEVWDRVPGVQSQMGTHGYASRPGSGPLALSGSVGVSGSGKVALTSTMLNALKSGTAYGVGFAQNTGWRRFDTYARSGTITITWEP